MKTHLQALLTSALASVCADKNLPVPDFIPLIEPTKDKAHGDFASNLAMVCCKLLGMPPRVLAQALIAGLPSNAQVSKVEIAGPGFINFFLAADAFVAHVPQILAAGSTWGQDLSGQRGRVMVEFVSANPTGPMHVGHGRGAAYGDTLANLLAATGYTVHREYYINDAGRQVDILGLSVWLRYLQIFGEELSFPKRGYPADYIVECAQRIKAAHGDYFYRPVADLLAGISAEPQVPDAADEATKAAIKLQQEAWADLLIARAQTLLGEGYQQIVQAAIADQMQVISGTLVSFNVRFDQWYSEAALVKSGFAAQAIDRLRQTGHVYRKDGAEWLRTTDFGDEKDRVLFKADGAATYFANDLAYHIDKLDRGYALLVDVWGADHHGYIARVRAAIEMLTDKKEALHVALMQFVTLSSGRMGKRSGNFVTLQDLLDEAGADATRFFYLSRSHDQHLEFDVDLARSQSKDNPVFYPQYAYARICSVFRQLAEKSGVYDSAQGLAHLTLLSTDEERLVISVLAKYPQVLQAAAQNRTPHTLAFYLKDLAEALHAWYHAHKFLVDDAPLQNARLTLAVAVQTVLAGAFALMGVSAPERM